MQCMCAAQYAVVLQVWIEQRLTSAVKCAQGDVWSCREELLIDQTSEERSQVITGRQTEVLTCIVGCVHIVTHLYEVTSRALQG